jgi:cytoskeletal protein RodZ
MAGFGETLRQARAHKGVSLKEAEQATRITRHYLAALEEEDFSSLPPVIYQRGFVRNYSIYLDLDPSKTLAMFEEAHGSGARPTEPNVTAVPPIDMPNHWAPNFAIIAFSVVLSAIVFAWVYTAYVAPSDAEREATPPLATVTAYPEQDIALPTKAVPTETPEATATTQTESEAPAATEEPTTSSGGDNQLNNQQADNATTAQPSEDGDGSEPSGDNSRASSGEESDDQEAEEPTEEPQPTEEPEATAEPTQYVKQGEYDTTIEVTAQSDIYVSFYADGNLVFDGNLAAGESTGAIPGSSFEVYTTAGTSTLFTNGCGDEFFMAPETNGEVTYTLNASADSCQVDPATLGN